MIQTLPSDEVASYEAMRVAWYGGLLCETDAEIMAEAECARILCETVWSM